MRAADGLALSSRNRFLSAAEREQATSLSPGCAPPRALYAGGERDADALWARPRAPGSPIAPDYLELRRRDDLGAYDPSRPAVLLVAARVGTTRLIDNLSLEDA